MAEYLEGKHAIAEAIIAGVPIERFMVAAEGEGASMDELKAATAAIGPARLEALIKG